MREARHDETLKKPQKERRKEKVGLSEIYVFSISGKSWEGEKGPKQGRRRRRRTNDWWSKSHVARARTAPRSPTQPDKTKNKGGKKKGGGDTPYPAHRRPTACRKEIIRRPSGPPRRASPLGRRPVGGPDCPPLVHVARSPRPDPPSPPAPPPPTWGSIKIAISRQQPNKKKK